MRVEISLYFEAVRIMITEEELKQQNTRMRDSLTHVCCATFGARLLSYDSWPTLKQNPLKLFYAEFFYTGMFGEDKNSAYYSKTGVKNPCTMNVLFYTGKEQGSHAPCNK
jgi:hypothetical protein